MALILSNKHKDFLALAIRPDTRLLTLEGTVRSTKTVIVIQAFYLRVKMSKDNLFLLAARDYDAIKNNILENNGFGLMSLFSDVKMVKSKIGGYELQILGLDNEIKRVLLVSYSDASKWKKILGNTIAGALVDEANIADRTFINELFSRQTSIDYPFVFFTLNGDNPDHFIYQDFINYSKPLWKVPSEILSLMQPFEKKKGYYYTHWTMEDNPIMTAEKIERAKSLYPKDSYYYTIKILGLRGTAEGSIFAQYLNDSYLSKKKDFIFNATKTNMDEIEYNLATSRYIKYTIGIDLGGQDGKFGTILCFTAFTMRYNTAEVIDTYQCKSKDSESLTNEIVNVVAGWHRQVLDLSKMDSIRIDGFGSVHVLIPTIRKKLVAAKINTLTDLAIKFGDDGGRQSRITTMLMLVAQNRLRFNSNRNGGLELYKQLKKLVYDPKDSGLPFDANQIENDYYDALGYTLTPFTREITNVQKRG